MIHFQRNGRTLALYFAEIISNKLLYLISFEKYRGNPYKFIRCPFEGFHLPSAYTYFRETINRALSSKWPFGLLLKVSFTVFDWILVYGTRQHATPPKRLVSPFNAIRFDLQTEASFGLSPGNFTLIHNNACGLPYCQTSVPTSLIHQL